jgi:tetrahydromethanopterin S-methyltransferase subunit F
MAWNPVTRQTSGGSWTFNLSGITAWLLASLLLWAHPVLAAQIEVTLDRNPVPINESFTLTFTANESPDDDPDFSPLQANFEVLNQSQSSQMSIVNGRATRHISWQLQVMAKKTGTLDIPSIAFGQDASRPFAVTVTHGAVTGKQGGEANILLEAEAEPKNPYVQAQVILTLRVLSRVAFNGDLGQPEVSDAVVEKLDEDREYVTLREGVQFKVNERRFVLFPQKSGRLTIPSVNLTAQVGGSSFGPFYRPSTRQQRLHSDPIDLEVRPIPAQFTGQHWLPATNVELTEQWQPASLKVPGGEPVTRTLMIKAEGAGVGQLPEMNSMDLPVADIRQYPDQPVSRESRTESGLVSQREQKTALIATRGGRYTLPAMEVPWWNTVTDQMEVARLPAHELTVSAVAGEAAAPAASPATPASVAPDATDQALVKAEPPNATSDRWFWLALLCGLGWLLTGLAWWRSRVSSENTESLPRENPAAESERQLIRALENACKANDPKAVRHAFDRWAESRWPDLPAGNRHLQWNGALRGKLDELNRSVFSAEDGLAWSGAEFLKVFKAFVADQDVSGTKPPKDLDQLAALYK